MYPVTSIDGFLEGPVVLEEAAVVVEFMTLR